MVYLLLFSIFLEIKKIYQMHLVTVHFYLRPKKIFQLYSLDNLYASFPTIILILEERKNNLSWLDSR